MFRRYHRRNLRAHHREGPERFRSVHVDGHRVSSLRMCDDPYRGKTVRSVRKETSVPARYRSLCLRFDPCRCFHQYAHDVHLPWYPGYRRRYHHSRRHRSHCGSVLSDRKGEDAGYARCYIRCRYRYRSYSRGMDHRKHRLALVLLYQCPSCGHFYHLYCQEVPRTRNNRQTCDRLQGNRRSRCASDGFRPHL